MRAVLDSDKATPERRPPGARFGRFCVSQPYTYKWSAVLQQEVC